MLLFIFISNFKFKKLFNIFDTDVMINKLFSVLLNK